MVDVFYVTADNTAMTGKARSLRHPQSESLARLMISMLSEQLRSYYSLYRRGMMYNQRNERGSQKDGRKSECS